MSPLTRLDEADIPTSITPEEFGTAMSAFGAFEASPIIAVGVSGGADSMALVRLLDGWVRERNGRIIGLSVDHGLRIESAEEARQTGVWLSELGIEHHILTWSEKKPASAIQAKARLARRKLMLNWCREAGVIHLAFAHHKDDQAETYMMRLAKGSGPDGLAGMAMIREFPEARIIRPFLKFTKTRLVATLRNLKQDWIEDPSNSMEQFERVRIRKSLSALDDAGVNVQKIARTMNEYAQHRAELDVLSASLIAKSVVLHPAGFAWLNANELSTSGDILGVRALGRLLFAIGGQEYGAAREKLNRAYHLVTSGPRQQGLTLAGCRIAVTKDGCLVCRENRNLPPEMVMKPGDNVYWDHRFRLKMVSNTNESAGFTLAALGERGWQAIVRQNPDLRYSPVPLMARFSLPALFYKGHIVQVPNLAFIVTKQYDVDVQLQDVAYFPREPILGAGYMND